MFNKKKEDRTVKKTSAMDKGEIKAFLGAGSNFDGKLSFDEMVRLDGKFSGEITSTDTLIVGQSGEIEGQISVGTLILSGKFTGDIKATSLVELRNPAVVTGTIETQSLIIDDKVIFNGQVKMQKEAERGPEQKPVHKKK